MRTDMRRSLSWFGTFKMEFISTCAELEKALQPSTWAAVDTIFGQRSLTTGLPRIQTAHRRKAFEVGAIWVLVNVWTISDWCCLRHCTTDRRKESSGIDEYAFSQPSRSSATAPVLAVCVESVVAMGGSVDETSGAAAPLRTWYHDRGIGHRSSVAQDSSHRATLSHGEMT